MVQLGVLLVSAAIQFFPQSMKLLRAHEQNEPGVCLKPNKREAPMQSNMQSIPNIPLVPFLMCPRAVARRLGVSERWVRDHATRRFPKLPVIKLGPLLRFRQADVDEFVERQRDDHSGTKRSS